MPNSNLITFAKLMNNLYSSNSHTTYESIQNTAIEISTAHEENRITSTEFWLLQSKLEKICQ